MEKVKIVLDADVIIHFSKGGCLSMLPSVFPEFGFVILSHVRDELRGETRVQVDNQIQLLKNITLIEFDPTGEMMREYIRLKSELNLGKGESACMVYCRYNNDVIGSSNLRDIKDYCKENSITFLTTVDFLYYAYHRGMMSLEECNCFMDKVRLHGSKLPDVDIEHYTPNNML